MILSLVLVFAAAIVPTTDLVTVSVPFAISLPPQVLAEWDSFSPLPQGVHGGIPVHLSEGPAMVRGRVDVLRRDGRRWVWRSTFAFDPTSTISEEEFDQGVLVRVEGSPLYLWGELPAHRSNAVALQRFRNVSIEGVPKDAILALYLASESSARTGAERFHFVPFARGLACATIGDASRCAELDIAATRVAVDFQAGGDTRVVQTAQQPEDSIRVVAKGNVVTHPRTVGSVAARALPWVALILQKGYVWSDALIDRTGGSFALERLRGASLAPPPAFGSFPSRPERGLLIHAYVGEERKPLFDPSAALLVFESSGEPLSSDIPLVTATPASDGSFRLTMLASGTYVLKLLSSSGAPGQITISPTVGVPYDAVFPSGPTVRGRVARSSGGLPADPLIVQVAPAGAFAQMVKSGDLMDRMRTTAADENGNFSVVLAAPGRYQVSIRWGSATAERTFEMKPAMSDVDLGDIVLKSGTTLHGEVPGCQGGEATAIAVPDLSKPPTFDELRAPIDASGHFHIEGLLPGPWSILIRCGDKSTPTTPTVITVPATGEVVIRFTQTER